MDKRQFLTAGLGVGLATAALAQPTPPKRPGTDDLGRTGEGERRPEIPRRKAKTTQLFLTPPCWPNSPQNPRLFRRLIALRPPLVLPRKRHQVPFQQRHRIK